MGFGDPLFELEARLAEASRPDRLAGAARHVLALFEERLEAERDRLALWLVAGLGSGILVYFALPAEPPLRTGLLACACAALLVLFAHGKRLMLEAGTILLLSAALGFLAAEIRTRIVAAPILERELGSVRIEGTLLSVDAGNRGRVKGLFAVRSIERLPPEAWPERVRVSFWPGTALATPGAVYGLRANLLPPQGPVAPGAYDFARRAYFERVGAVGYALAPPERLPEPPAGGLSNAIERARERLAQRIGERIEGAAGGVAIALVTGLRSDIPEDAEDDLRHSGLYHLISISGVHMSAIALGLFFGLRFLLALIPSVALRFPIKKWAAALTIAGSLAYLFFTGASVPTIRAFVMAALVLLAVIADRRALTMRNVALAAALILTAFPESALDPGFHMSFAATMALIALYEAWRGGQTSEREFSISRLRVYLLAIILSGLVAGLATAPFAAFHFQQATPLSLLANLLAIPVTDAVVMPAACLIYLLAPFGAEGPAIWLLGEGCRLILAIARFVSGLPGAVQGVPAGPPAALILIVFGGLWLLLWRSRWRRLGLLPMAAGAAVWSFATGPDILIDRDAGTIALRDETGRLGLIRGRGGSYEAETWLRRDGMLAAQSSRRARGRHCDALGCVVRLGAGGILAVSLDPGSLEEDCAHARILVSTGAVRRICAGPELVIDRRLLARLGPVAIRLTDGVPEILAANRHAGLRPWAPRMH